MTNNQQNLVVARFKDDGSGLPRFTRSATVEDLVKEILKSLPVDLIYFMVPSPDGKGFLFREAGHITLDIIPVEPQTLQAASQPSFILNQAEQGLVNGHISAPPSRVVEPIQQELNLEPPMPSNDKFVFTPESEPAKSQSELLKDRGLEQPVEAPKKRGRPKKISKSVLSTDPDEALPHPPKGGGRAQVTGFIPATPQQAAAASQFGKKY